MTWQNRVVWSEGMFLRPQHFQQQDRHMEAYVEGRTAQLVPYSWGLTQLSLDAALLKLGKVGLQKAAGVLDDGTPFAVPGAALQPEPLEIPKDLRNAVIYLGLPLRQAGAVETLFAPSDMLDTRFAAQEIEVQDAVAGADGRAPLHVAMPRLRLLHERHDRAGFSVIPIARVIERRADDTVLLDDEHIPSVLACGASARLMAMQADVQGLLHNRAQAIASRMGRGAASSTAEMNDFLLLQLVNRMEPLVRHGMSLPAQHPEALYRQLVSLAGELGTFTSTDNRPPVLPTYQHRDLTATFQPLIGILTDQLSAVFEQSAVPIPLEKHQYGIRVGKIVDRSLLTDCAFVMAARAAVDPEALRTNLPKRITIGSVERIRDLVTMQLGGVPIRPMPAEPRQIPFRANMVYFELNVHHDHWTAIKASAGVAVHVAGDVPGLDLELWAIRGRVS